MSTPVGHISGPVRHNCVPGKLRKTENRLLNVCSWKSRAAGGSHTPFAISIPEENRRHEVERHVSRVRTFALRTPHGASEASPRILRIGSPARQKEIVR